MRTAICISGKMEEVEKDLPFTKLHLIDKYQADVFVSTWDDETDYFGAVRLESEQLEGSVPLTEFKQHVGEGERFRAYNNQLSMGTERENVVCMLYKLWRCNELRRQYELENGFTYDCVIRFRCRITLYKFPLIQPKPNTIYIPEGNDYMGGWNDQIALGDSAAMNEHSSLYPHLWEYREKRYPLHPESIYRKHLEERKLNVERFPSKYVLRLRKR